MPKALSTSSCSSSSPSPLFPEDEGKQLRLVEEMDLLQPWLLRSRKTGDDNFERKRWLVRIRETREEGAPAAAAAALAVGSLIGAGEGRVAIRFFVFPFQYFWRGRVYEIKRSFRERSGGEF